MTSLTQRFKVIACESLARPVYAFSATSPNQIDTEMIAIGMHDHPRSLREKIQKEIDACEGLGYDAILLVYGLCGCATDGLIARKTPLVIPRAHDCITLLLGSRSTYLQQQNDFPGTYWYSQDYLERSARYGQSMALGSAATDEKQTLYNQYIEKYGRENADYLIETMDSWQKHYERAVVIETEFGVSAEILAIAKTHTEQHGWRLENMPGDLQIVKKLIHGEWDRDFLIVPPCHCIQMQNDEDIICAMGISEYSDNEQV